MSFYNARPAKIIVTKLTIIAKQADFYQDF
jgi:hypothetical protein